MLGFDRETRSPFLPEMDLGLEAIDRAVRGLNLAQAGDLDEELPPGYDAGVLEAWRDAGRLFNQGVDRIELTLAGEVQPVSASLTESGVTRLGRRLREPVLAVRTVEGRLLMGDFKESVTRCRVHPAAGDPVECVFDDTQKQQIRENLMHFVRITGKANVDADTGKIRNLAIERIEGLREDEDGPPAEAFWRSRSLAELAQSQDVHPMADIQKLFHTWPGEEDDGFEQAVDDLRHAGSGIADLE